MRRKATEEKGLIVLHRPVRHACLALALFWAGALLFQVQIHRASAEEGADGSDGPGTLVGRVGATVRRVTAGEAEKFCIGTSRQAVMILWLDPRGPFGRVGLEAGDLILELNGRAVKDPETFQQQVVSLEPFKRITLLAIDHRSGRIGYVQMVLR